MYMNLYLYEHLLSHSTSARRAPDFARTEAHFKKPLPYSQTKLLSKRLVPHGMSSRSKMSNTSKQMHS